MKTVGTILIVLSAVLFFGHIKGCVSTDIAYTTKYGYLWKQADKSSTIEAKEKYIKQFTDLLIENEHVDFAEYSAIVFKTPSNSFKNNLEAVKTLAERLDQIKKLDPNSFEYNTAIQQITGQEQGEAEVITQNIYFSYVLKNYKWGYPMYFLIGFTVYFIMGMFGLVMVNL